MKELIKCNSFDGAPGGALGALNYQTPVGTHSSPSNYQDPSKFNSSDYNKYYDKTQTGQPDTQISDNSGSFDKDVDVLFTKKKKPTIDDILCGLQYELQNMTQKDKHMAKQRVIDNLKKHGPKYYTSLHMLNINPDDLDSPMMERINVLNKMVAEKEEKRSGLKLNSAIQNILKDKREQKISKADFLIKLSR